MKTLFLLFALQCPFLASSQLIPIINDDFSTNNNRWYEGSKETYTIKVADGKYQIKTITPKSGTYSYLLPNIDFSKPFLLEASFLQTSGSIDNSFGLIWGAADTARNSFTIALNGYYYIETKYKSPDFNKWVTTKVNPLGTPNKLKVEHKNGRLYFYINDNVVQESQPLPVKNKAVGVITFTNMSLEVDDFKLLSDLKINLVKGWERSVPKENMGNLFNTQYNEVSPIVSLDGKTIYFGRENASTNLGGEEDGEDVMFATSPDGERWNAAQNMGENLNTKLVDNLAAVSADNNLLLFCKRDGFVFKSRTPTGWIDADIVKFPFDTESQYMEACMSPTGKAIVFSFMYDKNLYYKKGVEDRDLYVILKDQNGKWGNPINLGKAINTQEDELSPFLSADNRTLYFASQGLPGFGSADIFMTKRIGDGWTSWTEPLNLGPNINTSGFDAYYTIPASGHYGYMVSNNGGKGLADIVRIKLFDEIKPNPVVLVKGRTLNAATGKPIPAAIAFENLLLNKEEGLAQSNPSTGEYAIALPYGINYGLHANAEGFLSVNENFELLGINNYQEIQKDLYLIPLEVGQTVTLNNVFFEQGLPALKKESYPELDRLAQVLSTQPSLKIEIRGHTDNVGARDKLVKLSNDRAETVKKYLIARGINPKRLTGKGYGPDKPIAANDSEENRKKNRRVEFSIIR